jgi:hypothetical protein
MENTEGSSLAFLFFWKILSTTQSQLNHFHLPRFYIYYFLDWTFGKHRRNSFLVSGRTVVCMCEVRKCTRSHNRKILLHFGEKLREFFGCFFQFELFMLLNNWKIIILTMLCKCSPQRSKVFTQWCTFSLFLHHLIDN